jgi:hypothetical protein
MMMMEAFSHSPSLFVFAIFLDRDCMRSVRVPVYVQQVHGTLRGCPSTNLKIENRPSTLKLGTGSEKLLVMKPPCPLV